MFTFRECANCRKEFPIPAYRQSTAKYCSRKCQAVGNITKQKAKCTKCGKLFTFSACRSITAKYCSNRCKGRAMTGTVERICLCCDKKFFVSPSRKQRFCSRNCRYSYDRDNYDNRDLKFMAVRSHMKRSGMLNKCQRCGYSEEPRIIVVHHKDGNRKNNRISNLAVLCPNCHSLEHLR